MNFKKVIVIVFLVIVVLGFIFYAALGGFKKPDLAVKVAPEYVIVGKKYKGFLTDQGFGECFEAAEGLIVQGKVKGVVAALFLTNPENVKDSVHAIVGVLTHEQISEAPQGFVSEKISSRKVVEAVIASHYLVASVNIYPEIKEFAQEKKIAIEPKQSLEIYAAQDTIVVQVPVK